MGGERECQGLRLGQGERREAKPEKVTERGRGEPTHPAHRRRGRQRELSQAICGFYDPSARGGGRE